MYKLSPSKAHRYLQCTKSLEFDKEFVESPFTIRGSILHKYAEMLIKNEDTSLFVLQNDITDYENFLIKSYVETVFQEKTKVEADNIIVEEKRTISLYGNSINLIIDALCVGKKIASIIDLKTGNNDIDPNDNEQLLFYAYSIINEYPQVNKFRLSIFQKGKIKTNVVTKDYVMEYFMEKFDVFMQIKDNKLTYNPSEKACKYCSNKDSCRARAEWIIGGKK